MNIIEAWKKAKNGEKISQHGINKAIKTDFTRHLLECINAIGYDNVVADDWEVVRNPLVWEGEVEWDTFTNDSDWVIPIGTGKEKVNSELKRLFCKKRTKIRIEEILE